MVILFVLVRNVNTFVTYAGVCPNTIHQVVLAVAVLYCDTYAKVISYNASLEGLLCDSLTLANFDIPETISYVKPCYPE